MNNKQTKMTTTVLALRLGNASEAGERTSEADERPLGHRLWSTTEEKFGWLGVQERHSPATAAPLVPPLKAHGSGGATSQPGEPSKESPQAAGEIHSRRVGFQAETAELITCGHEPMMKKEEKSEKAEMNNKCEPRTADANIQSATRPIFRPGLSKCWELYWRRFCCRLHSLCSLMSQNARPLTERAGGQDEAKWKRARSQGEISKRIRINETKREERGRRGGHRQEMCGQLVAVEKAAPRC